MRRKLGIFFMVLGVLLVLGSLGLLLLNRREAEQAQQASADLMPRLEQAIEENLSNRENAPPLETEPIIPGTPLEMLDPELLKMTEVEIDGHSYIGYLSIPSLSLELPVMADWDYQKLKIAPCRMCGTTKEENLVVMAHNYRRHFGALDQLRPGDEVVFVDMDNVTTVYEVVATDVVIPTAVEEVTSGDFDLTLFTCTYGGRTRVVVYCDAVERGEIKKP